MKNVTFYVFNKKSQFNLDSAEHLICNIVTEYWRSERQVLTFCKDKNKLFFDEALWQKPIESFIPHNLVGEGPKKGAPVEIIWSEKYIHFKYDVLISLCINSDNSFISFEEVIDSVPNEESLRELARKRYISYRLAGFKLNVINLR